VGAASHSRRVAALELAGGGGTILGEQVPNQICRPIPERRRKWEPVPDLHETDWTAA
jgi:hypothetical protein